LNKLDLFAAQGGESAKRYLDGTHRLTDPATTLARVMPLAGRMGITRVAVLTGLDVIGIPVVAAYRPNSRSIAVHQGKGTTLAAAKASAVMEAVESYHAENITTDVRLASFVEVGAHGAAVAPERLPLAAGAGECSGHDRLLWIAGHDLMTGGARYVPYELVCADFT
jgi:YcaO-like protein with predicted kinase domain